MNQNQNEVAALAAVAPVAQTQIVSAITLAYGASVQNAQMAFAVAMAFDCAPSIANESKSFTFAKYVDQVVESSAHAISKKTVQNNMTLTRAILDKHLVVLGTHSKDEAGINAFMDWMREQVAKTTYTLKRDDLIAWCKGEASDADKRAKAAADAAAAREAMAKAAADKAAADAAAPAPVPLAAVVLQQQLTDEEKAAAEAEQQKAKREQEEREQAAAEEAKAAGLRMKAEREAKEQRDREQAELAEAKAAVEKAEKQAASHIITVAMNADGTPNIVVDRFMSAAFLDKVTKELADMAKALRVQQKKSMADKKAA